MCVGGNSNDLTTGKNSMRAWISSWNKVRCPLHKMHCDCSLFYDIFLLIWLCRVSPEELCQQEWILDSQYDQSVTVIWWAESGRYRHILSQDRFSYYSMALIKHMVFALWYRSWLIFYCGLILFHESTSRSLTLWKQETQQGYKMLLKPCCWMLVRNVSS